MTPDRSGLAARLDWNLLRTFLVTIEAGGITAAAQRLGLKQPSVSNSLRRLEDTLGHRLIERGPRNFEPTPEGLALRAEVLDMHAALERLPALLADAGGAVEGEVALSLATHVVCPLIDATLAGFRRAHPSASIAIRVRASRDVIEDVRARRCALGICLVRVEEPGFEYTHLYTEHFGFFCGPGHRLHGKRRLRLEDLAGEPCVSFDTEQPDDVLGPVAALRERANLAVAPAGVSNNLEEVRRMVLAGLGIGPLPIHVVARDVQDGLLWRLPPYEDTPAVKVSVVRRPDVRTSRAEQAFHALLSRQIAATPLARRTYGLERSRTAAPAAATTERRA